MDRCPYCGSDNIYFSKKRKEYVCEDCDRTFSPEQAADSYCHSGEKQLKLFFSYGHDRNRPLVERLKRDLSKRGHDVWIDTSELVHSDSWRRDIFNGVVNSASVIAFLSEHSTRKASVCLDELKIAVCVKGANIRTILLEPENRVRQPAMVSDIQWLDMSEWVEKKAGGEECFEQWYRSKFTELCQAIESDGTCQFNGEVQLLRNLLQPYLSTEKEYNLLSKEFYGRAWLQERIEHWQDRTSSKALIIYGRPGSGKSAFCVNYAHYNSDVYGCFLCEWNHEYSIHPAKLIKTMAFRLATKLPDYRSMLLRQLQTDGLALDDMKAENLFEYLLTYPLNHLVDGDRETGIIVVDGLDEAEVGGENPVAQIFSRSVEQLPRWIKFIFTSRSERSVIRHFPTTDSLDIVKDIPEGYNDIMAYLLHSLQGLQRLPNRLEVLNRICCLSEGIFLYAVLLVDDINEGVIDINDVHNLPRGLNAFYGVSMERKFRTEEEYLEVRPFLEMLCVADAVPEVFVISICGFTKYNYLMLLDRLGSWVVRHEQGDMTTLGLFHKSVSDWLCNGEYSGRFFVDSRVGALRLARFCRRKLENGEREIAPSAREYIRSHVGGYYVAAEAFQELESFLLAHTSRLSPYWAVWDRFPFAWNHQRLLAAFWGSPDRDAFMRQLQQEGNTEFLLWVFGLAKEKYGIGHLERELVSIYMDIVHLSGDCPQAVEIANQYLQGYSLSEILNDDFLVMLYVRRLHHSMFFKPLRRLLDDAQCLFAQVSDRYPMVYNEVVFLIGGNLCVLLGEWDMARKWLLKSEDYARQHHLIMFHKRNMRKLGDCYCHDGQYELAERTILDGLNNQKVIHERYDLYLMGALANVCTSVGNEDEALQCYEDILKYATAKGIAGWIAHANLGIANVNFKLSNLKEAADFARRAKKLYGRIRQEWGEIMSDAILAACESRMGVAPMSTICKDVIRRAARMEYGSCVESIETLGRGECNYLKLYFI